ncbi:adenylate/guanylate cyclase domain-containing protein [Aerosakkonemataceae cyanobacterium BLCC-F50]|uniref:Adenylate/guanylate cyclase domain-containing protein n=1 Tax=Floridaenema flaviceps BLCC-F50 TaxID=3153642 RepID=A0ABV4XJN4_9CYAN
MLKRFTKINKYLPPANLVITSCITGLIATGSQLGFFRIVEWATLDQFFRLRPQEAIDNRIVIVTIDEPDIKYVKKWPMSDAVMAQILRNIKAQQPRAIAIDIIRDIPVEPGHQELVEIFESTPNLIGVEKIAGQSIAPPPSLEKLGQVATIDLVLDPDGKIRRGIVLLGKNGTLRQGLGVKLALNYLKKEGIKLKAINPKQHIYGLGKATFSPLSGNDGEYNESELGGYQILLNYRGGMNIFPTISMTDVLENRIPPDLMRDRIVFLGPKAPSLHDAFLTPYSSNKFNTVDLMPGVFIHANITSQILSAALENRPMLRATVKPINWLIIFLWSGYSATLGSFYIRNRWLSLGGILLAGVIIVSSSYIAFLLGWLVPVFTPLLAVVAAAVVSIGQVLWQNLMLSYRQLEDYARNLEEKVEARTQELFLEKERSEKLLLNILPKSIAEKLKTNQSSIAEYFEEATILFSDIVGFTQVSSQISPIELVELLNQMFSLFDRLTEKYNLEKIKTIGDAYMVVGGLPIPQENHVQLVAEMALEMQLKMQELQNYSENSFQIRVGIHCGPVVAGVIGTKKFVYDLWGDTVNVASRMESTGTPGKIHVSSSIYEKLKEEFIFEKRDIITVKGKGEMQTYWLIGKGANF